MLIMCITRPPGTIQIRALFPNPDGKLYPGLFARIRVPFEDITNALLVREESVLTDLTGSYVLVVDDAKIAQRRSVTLGGRYEGKRHVLKGLTGEDVYIVRGIQKARPGQLVEPLEGKPKGGS